MPYLTQSYRALAENVVVAALGKTFAISVWLSIVKSQLQVLFYYDWLEMLPLEITEIWVQKTSIAKLLYPGTRYTNLATWAIMGAQVFSLNNLVGSSSRLQLNSDGSLTAYVTILLC